VDDVDFRVLVWRVGQADLNERSLERHRMRGDALHEAFPGDDPALQVRDWGATDSDEPREYIELIFHWMLPGLPVAAVEWTVAKWVLGELADKAVDEGVTAGFKALMGRLRKPKQEAKIEGFKVTTADFSVMVEVMERKAGVVSAELRFGDGSSFTYEGPTE